MLVRTILSAAVLASSILGESATPKCSAKHIQLPTIPGLKFLSKTADPVKHYPIEATATQSSAKWNATLDICNVTVTYGHEGWGDKINVHVWLPIQGWNGRMVGSGGGGFSGISNFTRMAPNALLGYATVGTDTGHILDVLRASTWALDQDGRVNFFLTQNFFSVALNEAAIIGKKVVESAYGQGPRFSFWNGCSTGGRQGLMLAQRYPTAYDGILAGAPAINWATFLPALYNAQLVMHELGHFPTQDAFTALTNFAVEACDGLDGLTDGILSLPSKCDFNPHSVIGRKISSRGQTVTITAADAEVAGRIWAGPKAADSSQLWPGLPKGASFLDTSNSVCQNGVCEGRPFPITEDWIKLFVLQNRDFNLTTLTPEGLEAAISLSVAAYKQITSTDNPHLKEFRKAGGKLIQWHGTADQQIYFQGSDQYYNNVEKVDPDVRDFYRYFHAPGAAHCGGGVGIVPDDPFSALVDWVEKGIAPEMLPATSTDGTQHRNLCQFPLVPAYKKGDHTKAASFKCQKAYD